MKRSPHVFCGGDSRIAPWLLLCSLVLVTAIVMFVNNLLYFLLPIVSGANVPLQQLPGWIQAISSVLPLTRGIAATRLLVGGASLSEAAPLLWGELGTGVMCSLLGYDLFTIFELEAKRRGSLELVRPASCTWRRQDTEGD